MNKDNKLKKLVAAAKDNPVVGAFILDALNKWADAVISCTEWPKNYIITLEAWKQAAETVKTAIED
jgi:hypothetical protein